MIFIISKKYLVLVSIIIFIICVGVLEYSQGIVSGLVFNEMNYDYSGHVLIPGNSFSSGSLGGYYIVNGSGHNFSMLMVLTGGVNDTSSPLDYTSDGLHVTGKIDTVKATPNTIISLFGNNFKQALFFTVFNGSLVMKCSVWNGTSQFENDGNNNLKGKFQISGAITDWEGNYTISSEKNYILLSGEYIYYPHGKKNSTNVKYVQKDYYL